MGKEFITEAMTEALSERARAGVRVRVVVDALGSERIAHHQVATPARRRGRPLLLPPAVHTARDGAGHMLPLTDPEIVADHVAEWVTRVPLAD